MTSQNKRYPLNLPLELFQDVKHEAKKRDISVAYLMRSFLRLGLEVVGDNKRVVVVDGENREREIKILL